MGRESRNVEENGRTEERWSGGGNEYSEEMAVNVPLAENFSLYLQLLGVGRFNQCLEDLDGVSNAPSPRNPGAYPRQTHRQIFGSQRNTWRHMFRHQPPISQAIWETDQEDAGPPTLPQYCECSHVSSD